MRAHIMENKHFAIFSAMLSFCFTIFFLTFAWAYKPLTECPPYDGMVREPSGINVNIWDNTSPEQPPAETKPRDECARWQKTCDAWKNYYEMWEEKYDDKKPANLQRNIILRMNNYAYHYNSNCPKNCPSYGKLPIKPLPQP
jgi:hypothetical protein